MTEEAHEPDTTELARRAETAREQLMSSLSRLDQRAKKMMHQATDASLASGLSLAAAVTFWLSMAVRPRPRLQADSHVPHVRQRASAWSLVLRGAAVAAGLVVTGLLVQAAERRARNLGVSNGYNGRSSRSPFAQSQSHL